MSLAVPSLYRSVIKWKNCVDDNMVENLLSINQDRIMVMRCYQTCGIAVGHDEIHKDCQVSIVLPKFG